MKPGSVGVTAGADTQETCQGDQNDLDQGITSSSFRHGAKAESEEARLRFRSLGRESLEVFIIPGSVIVGHRTDVLREVAESLVGLPHRERVPLPIPQLFLILRSLS